MADGTRLKECLDGQKRIEQSLIAEILKRDVAKQKQGEIQFRNQDIQMEILRQLENIQKRIETIEVRTEPMISSSSPQVNGRSGSSFPDDNPFATEPSILGKPPFAMDLHNLHGDRSHQKSGSNGNSG
ncbi:unnamed protein product [Cuscuta europaea]|uniref:Uncharacterized protein n=1 Tax=Cuscuta europaea TaxID=41803 RepID=A0A9P0ZHT2_CUSEU|nr:unnamed protein product [Cuscuta europaea]